MATQAEYALMAGDAYVSTRPYDNNKFPAPLGWEETVKPYTINNESGFEAVSFVRGSGDDQEVVISFAGTDPKSISDLAADFALATGSFHMQLFDAAQYYLEIKTLYPDAKITLTGHSLGGGLAALIGVFFNVKAVTFDQAPFKNTAEQYPSANVKSPAQIVFESLEGKYSAEYLKPLSDFIESFTNSALSGDDLSHRAANVTGYYVQGEALTTTCSYNVVDLLDSAKCCNLYLETISTLCQAISKKQTHSYFTEVRCENY